ncbi:MAG: hypothetical protein IPL46_05160 [Saprospiraceae bacterium]|nr:hypothetical protein [Saprospiraceae bacterium]
MQNNTTSVCAAVEVGIRVNYAVKLLVFGIFLWASPVIGKHSLHNSNFYSVNLDREARTLVQPNGFEIEILRRGSHSVSYLEIYHGYSSKKNAVPVLDGIQPMSQAADYCAAGAEQTTFEKIANVQFHTIDNSSTENAGYQDFTSINTYMIRGTTYQFTGSIFNPFDQDQILVWIDFNQDGDFFDSGEAVFASTTGVGPHSAMIQIPPTATIGQTRMRVRLHDSGLQPNSTPCGDSKYGQVEDYTLYIGSGGSGNCDDMMTLLAPDDNIFSGTHKTEVNFELTAKNQIMSGNVTYDAGMAIILDAGFEIHAGAELTLQIDGCGNN